MFRVCLLIGSVVIGAGSARADDREHAAVGRALKFLQDDAAKWRKEKKCATCHHGTMTTWALAEAKSSGFTVGDAVKEMAAWTGERFTDLDKPRDTRPGWSMVSTPALNLAMMATCIPGQDAISAKDLGRIAGHLLRHQEADGSWSWASAPAKNRPPPVFESDEVATLLGYLALAPQAAGKAEVRAARDKAAAWLAKTSPTDTTQAAGLRLLVKVRAGEPTAVVQPLIDQFLARQSKDGGWPQIPGAASDAFGTGQALYFLNLVGVKNDRAEVRRAVAFLVRQQRDDGSWPMTPRSHPGATPSANPWPITHFGSAWATLGVLRSVPNSPGSGAR
jgi:hypothetical protein